MSKSAIKISLLIIDPQVDFCDPDVGSLCVPGALEDMERLAAMINRIGHKLNDINVTLDSHRLYDIAHPLAWKDANGAHPAPFTIISAADVSAGVWVSSIPSLQKRFADYVNGLEANSRYPLCIWPPHCLIGSRGHNVIPVLYEALQEWEEKEMAMVDYVTKGSNPFTEHYSAVVADVPDPSDPSTQLNTDLINKLGESDVILLAGEAGSHCLANTGRDIANNFGEENIKKIVLLTDATSPVPGFENLQDDFIVEMVGRGMQTSTTVDYLS